MRDIVIFIALSSLLFLHRIFVYDFWEKYVSHLIWKKKKKHLILSIWPAFNLFCTFIREKEKISITKIWPQPFNNNLSTFPHYCPHKKSQTLAVATGPMKIQCSLPLYLFLCHFWKHSWFECCSWPSHVPPPCCCTGSSFYEVAFVLWSKTHVEHLSFWKNF